MTFDGTWNIYKMIVSKLLVSEMKKSRKLYPPPDDIQAFFGWKKIIDQNELTDIDERENRTETCTDLSRRLSILPQASLAPSRRDSTWSSKTSSDGFSNILYKVPENAHITIINKWKEVDEAEKELTETRQVYKKKMNDLDHKYRALEKGQLAVKQKFVEFNNFVREKQVKVDLGKERVKLEKKAQNQKVVDLENLKENKKVLDQAKDILEKTIAGRKVFRDYLECVAASDPETYPDIQVLMMRCSALVNKRDSLKAHLETLERDIENENQSLEKFKENKMKQTLGKIKINLQMWRH